MEAAGLLILFLSWAFVAMSCLNPMWLEGGINPSKRTKFWWRYTYFLLAALFLLLIVLVNGLAGAGAN